MAEDCIFLFSFALSREQVTTTVQSFILKWLCMSLKFQLSKKISSLNLNRLTLIRFLDVREVRDRLFIRGVCVVVASGGGDVWGGGGGSSAGANRVEVIPFCAIENEGLHKILQPFLKGHVFFCISISILQKRNKGGISNTSNIVFFFKMMTYQTNQSFHLEKINLYCSVLLS